jgi:ATPase subunit of ABC transporter with duplicated ATPase domains
VVRRVRGCLPRTNHLDLESVERLESAIEEFDGTVVFVSQTLLPRPNRRPIVEVRDGEANAYGGGWSYWRERTGANRPAVAAS